MTDNRLSVGTELRRLRIGRKMTLREAGYRIGCAENYLSEIERDLKNPSDDIIRGMAVLYNLDEKYLFDRFGRIPLVVTEELRENDSLSRTIYNISTDESLTAEDKEELSEAIRKLYERHSKR